jgi:hypothetical protein
MSARLAWVSRALALGLCVVLTVSGSALAQDPRGAIVQKAARDWLAMTDNANALGSWNAAGSKFKESTTVKQWGVTLSQSRAPYGARDQRAVLSTSFSTKLEGVPEGEYAIIMFRTSFANRADSRETMTLERGADGEWRVIGYVIH